MAQIYGPYEEIDDTEIDAESPITESLMNRMRDQWHAALVQGDANAIAIGAQLLLPVAAKTAETNIDKALKPDGLGGVVWASPFAIPVVKAGHILVRQGDGTTTGIVQAWGLKTNNRTALFVGQAPNSGSYNWRSNIGIYSFGNSTNDFIEFALTAARYDSGGNVVNLTGNPIRTDSGTLPTFTSSIIADDTWRNVLSWSPGGANTWTLQLKTDGDNFQWRLTASGVSGDPDEGSFSLDVAIYEG